MTSWSKSVTIYTLWTEGPPPLIFRRNWGPRGPKIFFFRLPPLVSGSGWPPLSPTPLSEGMDPPLPTSNFIWGAPPREFELTCSLSLDKFPRRNSYTQLTVYCSWANWATMCYTCAWVLVKNCLYHRQWSGKNPLITRCLLKCAFAGDHPNDNGQIEELNKT